MKKLFSNKIATIALFVLLSMSAVSFTTNESKSEFGESKFKTNEITFKEEIKSPKVTGWIRAVVAVGRVVVKASAEAVAFVLEHNTQLGAGKAEIETSNEMIQNKIKEIN